MTSHFLLISSAYRRILLATALLPMGLLVGCGNTSGAGPGADEGVRPSLTLQALDVTDAIRPASSGQSISLEAARNEWTDFAIQVNPLPASGRVALRLASLRLTTPIHAGTSGLIGGESFEAYQILPMPVNVNRAGYIRHTGRTASSGQLPRALLPLQNTAGLVSLAALRDPAQLAKPAVHLNDGSADLWIDLHVPATAPAGNYESICTVVMLPRNAKGREQTIASLPVHLTVYDFALPATRHLQMLTQVNWESLVRHYPADFEAVTPRLITRDGDRYAGTVKILDGLMGLAEHNRLGMIVPRLQPTVKWPANIHNAPPEVDWSDFDSLVGPWFSGKAFADKTPLDYWPLPEPDGLINYDLMSRTQYWSRAATHFDENDWLSKASVSISKVAPGRATAADSLEMSMEAGQLLDAHQRIRVTLPLEDDQVQLNGPGVKGLIDPAMTDRLFTASPSLVCAPPMQAWPPGVREPEHWLRTDLPGLVPYLGAGGSERDVRLWAWLAFLRNARFVLWPSGLPTLADPAIPADPNELIWFYPGSWFGTDRPVPTVQLKWLRRAQQDYEYLWLAKDRGEIINALQMAQLITKPVEIQPGQIPDPMYTLMTGTTAPKAWSDAKNLLARTILLHEPGKKADPIRQQELYISTLLWQRPQERPLLMGRSTQWGWAIGPNGHNWVAMQFGLDIYNASAITPAGTLQWQPLPAGWESDPHPVEVPELATYQVRRINLNTQFNVTRITPAAREPIEVKLAIDGPTATLVSPLKIVAPIASSDRREGRFKFDGRLDDWSANDLIQDGPMVRMLDRPGVQQQKIERAATPAQIYTGWAAENFYVAFGLEGISKGVDTGRNFVDYQARRAWGEDLCEVLIQPIYGDNSLGPILHVVCKPNGSNWVERKLDPRFNVNPWESFESTGIRYAAASAPSDNGERWTGELAIPWKILTDAKRGAPTLLRFNFAQHRAATGESASWAGPVDFGREDAFTGLIHLHMAGAGLDDAVLNDPARMDR